MAAGPLTRRLLGLDPGLRRTGWGIVDMAGTHLKYVASGVVQTDDKRETPERLVQLLDGLNAVMDQWQPDEAAVEETFVNKNPASTLKLGLARGVVLLAPALRRLRVAEYSPNLVKKTVVGAGHADKTQIQAMVARLLPGSVTNQADAADALAIAICHAHHAQTQVLWRPGAAVDRIGAR
jgi:crossover junction endodeoxyribonuclease RuvC